MFAVLRVATFWLHGSCLLSDVRHFKRRWTWIFTEDGHGHGQRHGQRHEHRHIEMNMDMAMDVEMDRDTAKDMDVNVNMDIDIQYIDQKGDQNKKTCVVLYKKMFYKKSTKLNKNLFELACTTLEKYGNSEFST
jgi:hypothetical protein